MVILKVMFTNLQESDEGDYLIYHLPVTQKYRAHSKRIRQWIVAEFSRSLSFLAACRDVFCHIFLAWILFLDLYSLVQSVRFSELEWDGERAHTIRSLSAVRPPEHQRHIITTLVCHLLSPGTLLSLSCTFPRAPIPGLAVPGESHTGDCTHAPMVFQPIAAPGCTFCNFRELNPEFRSAGGSIPSLGDVPPDKILICHDVRRAAVSTSASLHSLLSVVGTNICGFHASSKN